MSYAELVHSSHAFAHALHALGLASGARIAIFLEKRIETVVSMLGALAAGYVFVPINPLLKPQQVAHVLRDCGAQCLVTSLGRLRLLEAQMPQSVEHVVVVERPEARRALLAHPAIVHGWPSHDDVAAREVVPTPALHAAGIDTDLAAILYTSGSTGQPKGVMLSHRNLLEGAWSVASYLHHRSTDRILVVLPLSFDAGLSQLTSAWSVGASAILLNYLSAQDVVHACEREQITAITGVPPLWMQLASARWPHAARTTLRYFANTGGRLPVPVLQKLRTLFSHATPYLMYGLTEAFRSTFLDPAQIDRRPDSIGRAVPNARVLVVREDGSPCAPEETGELVHVGAFVTLGYWNDAARTAARFRPSPEIKPGGAAPDIAVWSGDLVRQDSEGFIYFVARNDAQIKSSGYRISPEEIEEALHTSGLVTEVVALGVADTQLGEALVLLVVLANRSASTEALRLWCVAHLPRYMVPQRIVITETIPRNPNGKFDRVALRAALASGASNFKDATRHE